MSRTPNTGCRNSVNALNVLLRFGLLFPLLYSAMRLSSTGGDRQGQQLLRGEPVIVARVIKDLCTLLDYNQNGVDTKLVNAVAMTVTNLPVSRHILYQVCRQVVTSSSVYCCAELCNIILTPSVT